MFGLHWVRLCLPCKHGAVRLGGKCVILYLAKVPNTKNINCKIIIAIKIMEPESLVYLLSNSTENKIENF